MTSDHPPTAGAPTGRGATTGRGAPPAPEPARPRHAGGFTGLIDLAARRLGGMVLHASDEFFAAKENLLDPAPPRFDPHLYGDRGKVMDGWESRRRRDDGHDWVEVRLGVPGLVEAAVVDTSFFRGNYPAACGFEGCVSDDGPPGDDATWFPLLGRAELRGDAVQRLAMDHARRVTHVRFSIFPDGGVARLRVLGRPMPDLTRAVGAGGRLDLAAVVNGGRAVACSDEFFSSPHNLVAIGDARDMADGWETRRRRGPGEDWAVLELATDGVVERIELDTTNFKGNYPDRCVVEACHHPGAVGRDPVDVDDLGPWVELVPATAMQPHARHVFDVPDAEPATHLRLRVLPDGGVARLRAFGRITDDGWRRATLRRLDTAADAEARRLLLACCGSTAWADRMVGARPFGDAATLVARADEIWADLHTDDHLEAFAAHPRIGERSAARWSSQEQAGTAAADADTMAALADGNVAYEQRFGHVFLICATGRSADEMLAALRERLGNDPATELVVAAEQQREITRLRLDKLLRDGRIG